MRVSLTAALLALSLPTLAAAQTEPTCTFPWTDAHDYYAPFEVGHFYLSPYAEVIEVLTTVCLGYDGLVQPDGRVTRVCGAQGVAVRNVYGRGLISTQRKTVVWVNGEQLVYASAYVSSSTPRRAWGQLPDGCYPRSTVVQASDGTLVVR